jgi:hypothetical protein
LENNSKNQNNCVCVFLFLGNLKSQKLQKCKVTKFFGGDDFKNYNFEKYKKIYIPEKYFLKSKNPKTPK